MSGGLAPVSFRKVLVANRGEIALRVMRTCRAMGIATVAVYSEVDEDQLHVQMADEAVEIGAAAARASYLDVAAVVAAAVATGSDAVHPGYGFLSENAALARALEDAGIVFVGPPADVMEASADKLAVKRRAAEAGVPVIPGPLEPVAEAAAALCAAAAATGYPLLLKASAGGGGKGMRRVDEPGALEAAADSARREAGGAFGSTDLYLERIVEPARHVEVQVVCDDHGAVRCFGARDCSMQRRNQKVIEESPAPDLDTAPLEEAAGRLCEALGYRGAGTVEFLVEPDGAFWFLEVNRRLQVEHPVTEMCFGIDLVAMQLAVADGLRLPSDSNGFVSRGHAIEARIYAEDPANGFLPSPGEVLLAALPDGPGIRVDSALFSGMTVSPHYDPLLAKVIAHGEDRAQALARLDGALADTVVFGVRTNVAFLRALLADEDFRAARLCTGAIDERAAELVRAAPAGDAALAAAASAVLGVGASEPGEAGQVPSPWASLAGFRIGGGSA
jgi:acetyl-CoA/propionyl-CoA carboxylase biotin carboxyl carrier protein